MFKLSKEQHNKMIDFSKECPKINAGAIGGAWTYEFTPTNLGVITIVTFAKGTDKERVIDLTEYKDW